MISILCIILQSSHVLCPLLHILSYMFSYFCCSIFHVLYSKYPKFSFQINQPPTPLSSHFMFAFKFYIKFLEFMISILCFILQSSHVLYLLLQILSKMLHIILILYFMYYITNTHIFLFAPISSLHSIFISNILEFHD